MFQVSCSRPNVVHSCSKCLSQACVIFRHNAKMKATTALLYRVMRLGPTVRGFARQNSQPPYLTKELQFKVPWGHIAGKQWGEDNLPTIICIHGYMDNCNSFDRLIPLLPSTFKYIAIDYPGHGLSSHLPPGLSYTNDVYQWSVEQIRRQMKLRQVGILGHSLGSALSLINIYKHLDRVPFLIGFETIDIPYNPMEARLMHMARRIDKIIAQERYRDKEPFRTKEKLLAGMIKGYNNSLDAEGVLTLLERGAEEVEGKCRLRRDLRAQNNQIICTQSDLLQGPLPHYQNTMLCLIDGTRGVRQYGAAKLRRTLQNMANNIGPVEYHRVEGEHHFHFMNPEKVAPILRDFLSRVPSLPQD